MKRRGFSTDGKNNVEQYSPHSKGAPSPAESGFLFMANNTITNRGLLLYYTSIDEIMKIDSQSLGDLIKKELVWMSGKSAEPTFNDVRCDIFHMHLKEQIAVREISRKQHSKDKDEDDEPQVSTYTPIEDDKDIDEIMEEKEEVKSIPTYTPETTYPKDPNELYFSNAESLARYLTNIPKSQRDRQMNDLCRKWRIDFNEVLGLVKSSIYG